MQTINKQIASIYRKVLYNNKLAPINIIYTESHSWYDYALDDVQNSLLNFLPNNHNAPLDNHLYFINDPLYFSQIEHTLPFYVPKVLFFHNASLLSMKKEDLYLLNNKIKKYKKYTFIPELKNIISNMESIRYGFSSVSQESLLRRNKSIIFVAEEKNVDQIIFSNIKQKYSDADILFIKPDNININDILLNYRVCINLSSGYNTLLAASRGCITISAISEADIPNHYVANEISDIMKCLDYIHNNLSDQNHIINHNTITTKYSYSSFVSIIQNIVEEQLNTESIYE